MKRASKTLAESSNLEPISTQLMDDRTLVHKEQRWVCWQWRGQVWVTGEPPTTENQADVLVWVFPETDSETRI